MISLDSILEGAGSVGICGHVKPDGDAYGSCMGLYLFLKQYYPSVQAKVYLDDSYPDSFQFIACSQEIVLDYPDEPAHDVFFALDAADTGRVGKAMKYFEAAKKTVVIDHHISDTGYGMINEVHPEASSTSELIALMIGRDRITRQIAEPLYMGIVHDTGIFQFSCTSSRTMQIGGYLMDTGIDFSKICDETYYLKTYNQNQVLGRCLTESILMLDGKMIFSVVRKKDMDFYQVKPQDLDGIVQQLRVTRGVECAVFLYEISPCRFKVSMRSNGAVDVAKIGLYFQGGGHVRAAGCTMDGDLHDVVSNIAMQVEKQLKGMKEPESGPCLVDLALKGVSVADRNGYGNKAEAYGGYVMKHNRWKAYEMMSCYQGLLDYVEVKSGGVESGGLKNILKAAIMTAEDIVKEEVNLAGGCASSEAWFHGAKKQHLPYVHLQETCVTTTWMRFCEKLLEVTGDAKWADQVERTFYNAYLGALRSDGGEFAAYTPLTGNRWHGMNHCFMHTDCCTANGPRGFLCFLKELFTTRGDVATFNFYSSALVKGDLSGGRKVVFDMYSLYPRTDYVRIVSHTEGAAPVRLRIPAWSAKTEVTLNGKALDGVRAGGYFTIDRDWKLGDIVEIKFSMPVVAHTLDHHIAFTRGPVLLARDSRFADGDMTEPFRRGINDGQIMPTFAAVRAPSDDIWMAFSATLPIGSHHENPEGSNWEAIMFCDYASAGNKWTQNNYYRTWFPVEYGPEESESK